MTTTETTPIDTGTEKMLAHVEGGIGWMTYNNPARLNAMSYDMQIAVPRILGAFAADPDVHVVVVRGAGDRAFVSGADISEFSEKRTTVAARADYDDALAAAWGSWRMVDKPDHRHDPRVLHRRRPAHRHEGRHPHRGRRQPVRRARGQARPRVRVRRRRGAHVAGRAVVDVGDPVLGPPAERRGGAAASGWSTASSRSTSWRPRCASSRRPSQPTHRSR